MSALQKKGKLDLLSEGKLSRTCGSVGQRILIVNQVNYIHLTCESQGEAVLGGLGQGRVQKHAEK